MGQIFPSETPDVYSQTGTDLIWTPVTDQADDNWIISTGHDMILIRNTTGQAKSITVVSVPTGKSQRTGDLVATLQDGDVLLIQTKDDGWVQVVDPGGGPEKRIVINGATLPFVEAATFSLQAV